MVEMYKGFEIGEACSGYYGWRADKSNEALFSGQYIMQDSTTKSRCNQPVGNGWFSTLKEIKAAIDKHCKPKRVRKPKLYYKVCFVRRNYDGSGQYSRRFVSAARGLDSDIEVEYKVGEFVKPQLEGSRLFCFPTLDAAKYFVKNEMWNCTCKIFTCEVKNPQRVSFLAPMQDADKFWQVTKKYRQHRKGTLKSALKEEIRYLRNVPHLSYSCTELKLVEEVE